MGSLLGSFNTVRPCLGRNSHGPQIPLKTGKTKEGHGSVCWFTALLPPPLSVRKGYRFLAFKVFSQENLSFVLFMPQTRHHISGAVTVPGPLNESAWHGLAYILITKKTARLFQIYETWKVLLLHVNNRPSPPVTPALVLTERWEVSWVRNLTVWRKEGVLSLAFCFSELEEWEWNEGLDTVDLPTEWLSVWREGVCFQTS